MIDLFAELKDIMGNQKQSHCKGIIFRYRTSTYDGKHGTIEKRESYIPLKRRSCTGGCGDRCLRDFFYEDIGTCGLHDMDIEFPEHPQDGDVYALVYHAGSPDWETGYVEDWSWELRFIE